MNNPKSRANEYGRALRLLPQSDHCLVLALVTVVSRESVREKETTTRQGLIASLLLIFYAFFFASKTIVIIIIHALDGDGRGGEIAGICIFVLQSCDWPKL